MKVVRPKENIERYELETSAEAWERVLEIHSARISAKTKLTASARRHWKKHEASIIFGFVDFGTLSEEDILSILSAERRGEVRLSKNRFGDYCSYKIVA